MCLHIDWEPWCLQVHRPRDSVVLGVKTVARGPGAGASWSRPVASLSRT